MRCLVLGPGLDEHDEINELARLGCHRSALTDVIVAQALLAIAQNKKLDFGASRAAAVLTPHPGELSTLLGRKTDDIEAQREKVAAGLRAITM
jgi:NAD(P)H-hydrate repair Nnr-like enzyme with NAD(P)H-hydrate dehydratase domain